MLNPDQVRSLGLLDCHGSFSKAALAAIEGTKPVRHRQIHSLHVHHSHLKSTGQVLMCLFILQTPLMDGVGSVGSIDELLLLDERQCVDLGLRIVDQELLLRVRDAMRASQPLRFTAASAVNIELLRESANTAGDWAAGVRGPVEGGWGSAVCEWYTMHAGVHSARFMLRHRQGQSHQVHGLCVGVCLGDWDPRSHSDRVPQASGAGWLYRVRDGACLDGRLMATEWERDRKWCVTLCPKQPFNVTVPPQ